MDDSTIKLLVEDISIKKEACLLGLSSAEIVTTMLNRGVKSVPDFNFSYHSYVNVAQGIFPGGILAVPKDGFGLASQIAGRFVEYIKGDYQADPSVFIAATFDDIKDHANIDKSLAQDVTPASWIDPTVEDKNVNFVTTLCVIYGLFHPSRDQTIRSIDLNSILYEWFNMSGYKWRQNEHVLSLDLELVDMVTTTVLQSISNPNMDIRKEIGKNFSNILFRHRDEMNRMDTVNETRLERAKLYRSYFLRRFSLPDRAGVINYKDNATGGYSETVEFIKELMKGYDKKRHSLMFTIIASIDIFLALADKTIKFSRVWPATAFMNTVNNVYVSSLVCGWYCLANGFKNDDNRVGLPNEIWKNMHKNDLRDMSEAVKTDYDNKRVILESEHAPQASSSNARS